ncbi:MAG: response regulator [Tannerella sp.]|jgi:signal transduction histidine kinase/DNA-binding response OmpR family regulator/ligand-binding sensor domain-containing protein|nr:response regulator [Tannerella sp.]
MFQDWEGYIWLGTQNGFCRYDGYEMKSFRSEVSSPTFPSNFITGGFAEDTLNHTLWIGTEKGVLILDKRTCTAISPDTVLLGGAPVRQILYDAGNVWVCSDLGLYLYNPDRTVKKKYLNKANSIHIDDRGTVRITVWSGGMYYQDKASDTFVPCPEIGQRNNPHKIFQDNAGRYWVCTWGDGLYRFYPDRQGQNVYECVIMPDDKNLDFGIFFDIEQDDVNGYLWALSYAGITVFRPEDNRLVPVKEPAATVNALTNLFACIMKDRDGNLWIGTDEQGVLAVNPAPSAITGFDLQRIKTETGHNLNILKVFEDKEHELWLKSGRLGTYLFNRKTSEARKSDITEITHVTAICNYSALNEIWVAMNYEPNIHRLRKSNGKITLTGTMDMSAVTGNTQRVYFLHEDRNGNVWAATNDALLLWKHGEWQIAGEDFGTVTCMTEAADGDIWVGDADKGLWQVTQDANRIICRNHNTNTCPIPGNHISCISAGDSGHLWFCVNERLLYGYDIAGGRFTDYTREANIDRHVIFNVIAGDNGHVWISTNRQIIEFNPQTGASVQYDSRNGMTVGPLNKNAATKLHNGSIAFGGNKGFCILNASDKPDMPCKQATTVITDIKINGETVCQREANPDWQKQLILFPEETNLEINFSSFNYLNPGKTRYAYKLEGVDRQWIYTELSRNFAVYNHLRKGKYTFLVKSTGDNQLWSDEITRLTVTKKPAIYETAWAYAAYTGILLFLLFAGLRFYISRIKLRNELQIVQIDRKKSEELIQTKLRFFTNIGHEFRTPLTLLMTPLSAIITNLNDENLKQKLASVYRNAEDLLRLINQLLDFRKLEMGGETLKLSCDDFVKFAEYVHLAFKDVAANKSIRFTFESEVAPLFMSFDKSKVRKIINNLYSNALKFTPGGGYVTTAVRLVQKSGKEFVCLEVADSGCGIPDSEQQAIFNRFYQRANSDPDQTGSGIGLHLAKEYVEIHGGQITVDSKPGEGSVFSVFIPVNLQVAANNAGIVATSDGVSLQPETATANLAERKTLLIVEDNAELRHFLAEQFGRRFNVLQAADGREGLSVVLKDFPDLIVSDLMMPLMNGLELCRRLKNDIQTSHIPIILLTAKLSDEAKIETYKAGADSYIAKPFNFDVLSTRIEMLIEQQEKRKKLFHKTIEITPSSITTTSLDEELVRKALSDVEKNMDNTEYSVDDMALALSLSRRHLSRKLQFIIGLSPSEFIRSIRLKRAAQLLKNSQYNVSEIAYMVGFNTIKYFNLYFKDEFGVTPTQYRTGNTR